ncbi:MAG: hypothetical protein P8Y66_08560 [Nitrospirota bacterium]|jgi:hypothetical protein
MKRLFLLVAILLGLAACAPRWQSPGKTDTDLRQDTFACKVIARESATVTYTVKQKQKDTIYAEPVVKRRVDHDLFEKYFTECMQSRGWEKK